MDVNGLDLGALNVDGDNGGFGGPCCNMAFVLCEFESNELEIFWRTITGILLEKGARLYPLAGPSQGADLAGPSSQLYRNPGVRLPQWP